MQTQIKYTVHGVSEVPVPVTVQFNGAPIQATVPGLVVELLSDDGTMTHTLKLVPGDNIDALRAQYQPGVSITASFDLTPTP